MSSYIKKLKNPKTGKLQVAYCIDDYFGSHKYGYGFRKDGKDATFENLIHCECDFYKWEEMNQTTGETPENEKTNTIREHSVQEKCCEKCFSNYPKDKYHAEIICLNPNCDCHKPQEKSVVEDWEERFDKNWKNTLITAFGYRNIDDGMQRKVVAEQAYSMLKIDILYLQKETDDKWRKKIEEIMKVLERLKGDYPLGIIGTRRTGWRLAFDQATNIIKELVK